MCITFYLPKSQTSEIVSTSCHGISVFDGLRWPDGQRRCDFAEGLSQKFLFWNTWRTLILLCCVIGASLWECLTFPLTPPRIRWMSTLMYTVTLISKTRASTSHSYFPISLYFLVNFIIASQEQSYTENS